MHMSRLTFAVMCTRSRPRDDAIVQATLAARYDLLQKLLTVTRTQPLAPTSRPPLECAMALPTQRAEVRFRDCPSTLHGMSLELDGRHRCALL